MRSDRRELDVRGRRLERQRQRVAILTPLGALGGVERRSTRALARNRLVVSHRRPKTAGRSSAAARQGACARRGLSLRVTSRVPDSATRNRVSS
eukprot:1830062-Prymnesium_polylepis.1